MSRHPISLVLQLLLRTGRHTINNVCLNLHSGRYSIFVENLSNFLWSFTLITITFFNVDLFVAFSTLWKSRTYVIVCEAWRYETEKWEEANRRADNTLANRKKTKEQTVIYITLHRKLSTEWHEPTKTIGWTEVLQECLQLLLHTCTMP